MRTTLSRRGIAVWICLLCALPALSQAAELKFRSDTIIRLLERDTATKEDAIVMPGYEFLQLDAGQLSDFGLSFHIYGWGRADLADNDYYESQTAGELLYGYLEYRRAENNCNLRLGRQHVLAGVANEAIDGLSLGGDLGDYFKLTLYGGLPVGLDDVQGSKGDSIYGGRIAHHLGTLYEVGVSFKSIENHSDKAEETVGGDLSIFLPGNVSVYGFSAYNRETEGWAEHFYELRFPVGNVFFKADFQHFTYEDYFGVGANAVNPFRALAQDDEKLTAYSIEAMWQTDSSLSLGGKAKFFDYRESDGAASYSVMVTWSGEGKTQYGGEIGRTNADDAAGNDYTLVRLYGYCEAMADSYWLDFFSADLLLAYYDKEIYGEDRSLFVSIGGGKRFMNDTLSIKLSGDYSQDPYFDDDLRGMLTLSYVYENL